MSWNREANDEFLTLIGYSQEYLDSVHKGADEYRAMLAKRGTQPPWEPAESDTESEAGALLSPPPSPKGDGPDLSRAAWGRRIFSDLAQQIESRDRGFDSYERWRSHLIAEHVTKVSPSTRASQKRRRPRRRSCFFTPVSERSVRPMW